MKALRVIVSLALASCGGFLPFFGDDEEVDAPPPPEVADGSDDVSDAPSGADGSSVVDGTISRSDSGSACKTVNAACMLPSSCCSGLDCRAAVCCVPGGLYGNAAAECCSGVGDFDGFRGWFCRDVR